MVLLVAVSTVLVGTAAATRHRAEAAADLAALAAANHVREGADAACAWAVTVSRANHAMVTRCERIRIPSGYGGPACCDVVVTVRVTPPSPLQAFGYATSTARAGPS